MLKKHMSAQQKKEDSFRLDQLEKIEAAEPEKTRPNIDHLLKRINSEKKKERKNNIFTMLIGIVTIVIFSFIFTQN